eukprot:6491113-Amphidinium_carterae.3
MRDKYMRFWQMRNFKIDQYAYQKLTGVYPKASDWVTTVGPDENAAVLYACAECNCAPLKTNGWLKAKTCSSGSCTKVQWHCPHCGSKWIWGKSAPERWLIIFKGKDPEGRDDHNPA